MSERLVKLREKLAPLYDPLLSDFFDRPEIHETRATCDACAMCDHGQIAPVAMDYFRPDAKCCTYHPGLPNYLVGAILADTGDELAEGRRRLRARIAERMAVTPEYVSPPRKYNVIYAAARGTGFFGRSKVMLCPYFDEAGGGRCTVWRYRESVCSTYFCKYSAGKPGWEVWDALKAYLAHVERSLARFAALTVDPEVREPQYERYTLTLEDVEDLPPRDADYASFWANGKWVGREEEFYVACYERIKAVPRGEFAQNVDDSPEGRARLARLEAKYDAIAQAKVPPVLVRTTNIKKREAGEQVVVATYNPFDAFAVEKDLFEVLGTFKADETVAENLARLEREQEIGLAPELIEHLWLHGVLVAPEADKPSEGGKGEKAALEQPKPLMGNRQERRAAKKTKGKTRR